MYNNSDASSAKKKLYSEKMINMERCQKQGRKSLDKLDAEDFSQVLLMSKPAEQTFPYVFSETFCHTRAFSSLFSSLLALLFIYLGFEESR